MKKKILAAIGLLSVGTILAVGLTGCTSDSTRASQNISTEAEQFRIQRQFIFYNSLSDTYVASLVGKCSVDASDISNTITVTCKIGSDKYIKDYFRNADNVTWFALQTKPVAVDVYHYEVVLKPANIIPNLQVETGKNGATDDSTSGVTVTIPGPTSTDTATVPGKTGGNN